MKISPEMDQDYAASACLAQYVFRVNLYFSLCIPY